jgi:hypothetical protein
MVEIVGAETCYRGAKNIIKKDGNMQVDLVAWLMVVINAKENGLEIYLKCRDFWLTILNWDATSKCWLAWYFTTSRHDADPCSIIIFAIVTCPLSRSYQKYDTY